ncbi:hypothetical protein NIES2101_23380 [Calothrix sp. HK-06]|nr:hypothetical protein NIES2101_23380 [Calothrix sp. HK-06]
MNKEQTRVTLFLGRDKKTWDGKVLHYLSNHHPGKREGVSVVMELASAMWLPFAMKFFGASEAEKKEAALYSVRFLLAHVHMIVSEFGLTGVAMQGEVMRESARVESDGKANTEYSSNGNIEGKASIEDVEGDDIGEEEEEVWDFTELESGFVQASEKSN